MKKEPATPVGAPAVAPPEKTPEVRRIPRPPPPAVVRDVPGPAVPPVVRPLAAPMEPGREDAPQPPGPSSGPQPSPRRPPASGRGVDEVARSFVPPGTGSRPPPPPLPDSKPVEGRIGSIDIDRLTSELEKDILNTLTSEIGGILSTPPAAAHERKEVRDDHAAAARQPPRPAPPPPPRAQERALENEQRERRVAYRLGREFDKLPVNMRNELIKTLARADDVKVREDVVIACATNFEKLPPDVRGLLRTLANDRDSRVREEVAFELNRNFARITPDFRSELIPLLARDIDVKVREDIVAVIASQYDRHPPEIQELLKTLASDRKAGVRDQVQHEVLRNAERIPEQVRQEIARLIEKAAVESRERD
ncbi:MAG: HEAT repeat domain-containing protein [Euryarchaeota archaeon]|nr:HEAT repeat domain-containing protein [Euryarchaeota archaeon]